jgi:hypothetical protein
LEHWPSTRRKLLPIDVLHLGKPNHSWFGTDAVGRDMMAAYVHTNKWPRAMQQHDPAAVARVGPIADRLRVAGYPPSPFELPFVRPKKHTPPP